MSKKLGASTGKKRTVFLLGIAVLVALVGGVVYGVLEETGAIDSISSMIDSISSSTSAASDEASQQSQQQQQASSIVAQIEGIDQAMEANLQEQEYLHEKSHEQLSRVLYEIGHFAISGSFAGWVKAQENIIRLQQEYHQLLQDKLDLILELQALY